jgi:hypothetical protein
MDNKYIDGLFFKKPSPKAPSFIKGKMSIKKDKFINWLNTQDTEWVNIDILESQKGEFYGKVDEWKPTAQNGLSNDEVKQIQELRGEPKGIDAFEENSIDLSDVPF